MVKPIDIDIPMEAPFVQATLKHSHVTMRVKPNDDPLYAYDLAIPKTWSYGSAFGPTGSGPFTERALGIFAGGGDPGSPVIAVTVTPCPFEIPVDAWIRAKLAHDGWHIVSGFWFPGGTGLYYDITATRVVDDKPEVLRKTVRTRGNDIFAVNCMCAQENWSAAKEYFWVAHATFEVTTQGAETMEPWFEFVVTNPAADGPKFAVAHPGSWFSEPIAVAPEGVSALDVRLIDKKGQELLAYLQVKAERRDPYASRPTLEQRKADALMHMRRSGIDPDEATAEELTKDSDPRSIAVEGWVGGYALSGQFADAEAAMRIGFLDRNDVAFTVTALSPPIDKDLLVAMRTQRAFEIIRATLELQSASTSKTEQ